MRARSFVSAAFATSLISTAALAAPVPSGTVSSVALFNPTIVLSPTSSAYSTFSGGTFQVSGAGGFSKLAGTSGTLNGTLMFSNTPGTTVADPITNFFVFSDASGGTYNYSVDTVRTNSFVNTAGVFTSGTLYLLGSLIDSNLGFLTPTPASVSVQFNSTGGSAFASSLSLSTPVAMAAATPEPNVWAMLIVGFGLTGLVMRRRAKVATMIEERHVATPGASLNTLSL